MKLTLHRTEPQANAFRWYSLEVTHQPLGLWIAYGRFGRNGVRRYFPGSHEELHNKARKILNTRHRRGYALVGDEGVLDWFGITWPGPVEVQANQAKCYHLSFEQQLLLPIFDAATFP